MKRFSVGKSFEADCVISEVSRAGEIYHVAKNEHGGAMMTPIARYFAWKPEFVEGFHGHWRVDCFIRMHKSTRSGMHPLAPKAPTEMLNFGIDLVNTLRERELCDEPIWLSVHRSEELQGQAFGEVFDYD
jgi:hypothetical protein